MASFFNGTLFDEFGLNKDRFEAVVGLGASKGEVLKMFSAPLLAYRLSKHPYSKADVPVAMKDLDEWVRDNYNGMPFDTAYELIQTMTCKKFEEAMLEIGLRGNSSAISIMNEVIRKKEDSGIVKVVFENNLPLESEEDKEDDNT